MDHDLRININQRSVMIEWSSPKTGDIEMFRIDIPKLVGSSVEILGDITDYGAELDVTINSPVMPVSVAKTCEGAEKLASEHAMPSLSSLAESIRLD